MKEANSAGIHKMPVLTRFITFRIPVWYLSN